jgi:tight adherence protein B
MAIIAFLAFVPSALLLPLRFAPLSFVIAPVIGIGSVLLYPDKARSNRIHKFEEQLPDAIDLIVRSLKIGHPLSGAMAVVGRELPERHVRNSPQPSRRFRTGSDIPAAFQEMAARTTSGSRLRVNGDPNPAGVRGNWSSHCQAECGDPRTLPHVPKVKALTAEGRFSAWFLSMFPFALIFIVQLIKPDYYTQVMDIPVFPYLVLSTLILLTINVIAMRIITKIKA